MNKIMGLVKLRLLIMKNKHRNMSLMTTDKKIGSINRDLVDFGHMDFFDNYEELQQLIKNLNNNEKRVILSMPLESSRENYFYFDYIKKDDMLGYIEKRHNRVKCTLKKELKRNDYEKRSN